MEERIIYKSEPDKNGTVTIKKIVACPRCNGTGEYIYFSMGVRVQGICFKCNGTGTVEVKRKEYTKEHRMKLDEINNKKRECKRLKGLESDQEKIIAKFGKLDDFIYRVTGINSFIVKDDIKAKGGKYEEFLGWFFNQSQNDYQEEKILVSDFISVNEDGFYRLDSDKFQKKEIQKLKEKQAFIGEIKEKIEMPLILVKTNSFKTDWGITYILTFEDKDGNNLVWKTASIVTWKENEWKQVKFTVKEHGYYANRKQTYIKNVRCLKN